MNSVILIPARYQSSRYPGKPLVPLKGANGIAKPLIQRSVEAARRVSGVSGVFVVTDDEFAAVNSRLDQIDTRVQGAAQSAEAANQSAQRANQRLDQLEGRVQQLETAPRRRPRG